MVLHAVAGHHLRLSCPAHILQCASCSMNQLLVCILEHLTYLHLRHNLNSLPHKKPSTVLHHATGFIVQVQHQTLMEKAWRWAGRLQSLVIKSHSHNDE